jgi:crotonobetainyl-CoA:carnitine CoA-transferase CaiB-like acyl-CoA transferase
MILGDLGAEIVKVGPPAGAEARQAVKGGGQRELAHEAINRNKKSVLLNLKLQAGQTIFRQLAKGTDVIVEGFRPGVTKRLGIDYETISKRNPRIVYCSVTGYGQDGLYCDLPGHDINYISFAGALNLIGEANRPPVVPLNIIADYGAGGKDAVIGILSALLARNQTGQGQYIDIALTDSVISLMTETVLETYFTTGTSIKRGKHDLGGAYPYYSIYPTKDRKFITIGCLEPWLWTNLCRAIGKEEFIPFSITRNRYPRSADDQKAKEIHNCLEQLFLTRTRDEWFDFLRTKDVPIGKVYSLDEVFADPQVQHRRMAMEMEHPTEGKVRQVGIAIKLSDTPGEVRSFPPVPGQHTDEILSGLGYGQRRINELRRQRVVG